MPLGPKARVLVEALENGPKTVSELSQIVYGVDDAGGRVQQLIGNIRFTDGYKIKSESSYRLLRKGKGKS